MNLNFMSDAITHKNIHFLASLDHDVTKLNARQKF